MPEQPQWSERTLDMPPQDPWADPPTVPDRPADRYSASAGPHRATAAAPPAGSAGPPTRADGSTPPPPDLPFSAGRASVRPHPRSQPFAEHEPTGTGWPGAEVPYSRPTVRELRRGGEWTTAALLWAFVCWGIWALSNDGVWATKIIVFVVSVVVAGGLFALSRLVGRVVLEKQFHRVRRSARGSHAVASLFLAGVGLAHLQQTEWVMTALGWIINAVS